MTRLPKEVVEQITAFARSDAIETLLAGMQAEYEARWRSSKPEDTAHREHLYRMVQAVEGLKSEIKRVAQSDMVDLYNRGLLRRNPI